MAAAFVPTTPPLFAAFRSPSSDRRESDRATKLSKVEAAFGVEIAGGERSVDAENVVVMRVDLKFESPGVNDLPQRLVVGELGGSQS
jgi:hypothetical protein